MAAQVIRMNAAKVPTPIDPMDGEAACFVCGERARVSVEESRSLGLPGCCGGPMVLVSVFGCERQRGR